MLGRETFQREIFAATIEDLQKENANPSNQLIQVRDQAVKESDLKKAGRRACKLTEDR